MYPNQDPNFVPTQPGIDRHVESPTLLHYAAADGDVDAVRQLLAEGADPNATAYFGRTPLHVVVDQYAGRCRGFRNADRWAECTRLLLEAGANPLLRCSPYTTPAGLGEGHVPPSLRDAMVVLSTRGVWQEDERDAHERALCKKRNERKQIRGNFMDPEDMPLDVARPGERPVDKRCWLSESALDALTKVAARVEKLEAMDRMKENPEHVRRGWWNKRPPIRKDHAARRKAKLEAATLATA